MILEGYSNLGGLGWDENGLVIVGRIFFPINKSNHVVPKARYVNGHLFVI